MGGSSFVCWEHTCKARCKLASQIPFRLHTTPSQVLDDRGKAQAVHSPELTDLKVLGSVAPNRGRADDGVHILPGLVSDPLPPFGVVASSASNPRACHQYGEDICMLAEVFLRWSVGEERVLFVPA